MEPGAHIELTRAKGALNKSSEKQSCTENNITLLQLVQAWFYSRMPSVSAKALMWWNICLRIRRSPLHLFGDIIIFLFLAWTKQPKLRWPQVYTHMAIDKNNTQF